MAEISEKNAMILADNIWGLIENIAPEHRTNEETAFELIGLFEIAGVNVDQCSFSECINWHED